MYICNKQLNLDGVTFNPGEQIPDEKVLPSRKRALESAGYIAVVSDVVETGLPVADLLTAEVEIGKVTIPVIMASEGETAQVMAVPLLEGDVQQVFAIMQMNVPEAKEEIAKIEKEEILIVLHACDSRAGIKKAATDRADSINQHTTK